MKRSLVALALALALSNTALAGGDYSNAVVIQDMCDYAGQAGKIAYNIKAGVTHNWTREYFTNMVSTGHYADEKNRQAQIWAVNYGFDQASDLQDAYMKSWAHCMDLFN
ncbi:MAG: hypothetical protein WB870_13745 [Gallionellaceae bacterium]